VVSGANETQSPEGAAEASDVFQRTIADRIAHLPRACFHHPIRGERQN